MFRERKRQHQVRRGEIYYADLDPVVGSEQGGKRPVVIIQNDTGNLHSPTVIVAATTSKMDKPRLPTHILIKKHQTALNKDTIILLEQVRTIDRSRIGNYIGRLDGKSILLMDAALPVSFGIKQPPQTPNKKNYREAGNHHE